MKIEISVGGIIFYLTKKGEIFYLLLKHPSLNRKRVYWGFAKGRKEEGEENRETLIREIKEETGLEKIEILDGFLEDTSYFFWREKEKIFKKVIFYLVRAKEKKVKISFEHEDAKWFSYEKAMKALPFSNYRNLLKKANDFLREKYLK
jgi:8-oxo-dGTP pyrophosphatase MutT (NUDIX family)